MISLRTTMTPTERRSHTACTALVATVVILQVILMQSKWVEAMPYHQRTLRLCSRSLSDALFLVCKDRGFNEPFSYSGEVNDEEERRPASTTGPRRGLVQECCHRSCSIEHLERYCKPLPQPTQRDDTATRGNAIGYQEKR
ncbi:insulin-like growth factor I [Athalia rosae]|uniref:insulin-like growth factor I n=1 Tax=Athalia rosae TaxID=37344 RepID=UPI0020343ACB|nr:insulin-like growth factor I [Athalia rosae]